MKKKSIPAQVQPVVIEKLSSAVDEFAVRMKARLIQKAKQGYTGWDNPEEVMDFSLVSCMSDDINGRNPVSKAVDIANRAMMLWYRHSNR